MAVNNDQIIDGESEAKKQVYFETLAQLLFAAGVAPYKVGSVITDLDDHIAVAGIDPVEEFGPVGEFANTLATDLASESRWEAVMLNVVGLVAFGGFIVSAEGLIRYRGPEQTGLPVSLAITSGLLTLFIGLSNHFRQKGLVGNHADRKRIQAQLAVPSFLMMFVYLAMPKWAISAPTSFAYTLFGISVVTIGIVIWWATKRIRFPIPERLKYLQRPIGGAPFRLTENQ